MGEIGFPRREFLHDIRWWEVLAIIRGYNARHHAGWEQARLIAYNAHYCMGSKDPVPVVTEWIKFPWEQQHHAPLSQEDIHELQEEMRLINMNINKPEQQ